MKLKSVSDVITNSSTEVFVLKTDKSLEEVREILKSLTSGWKEPEVLSRHHGILKTVHEDWAFVFDPENKKDLEKWTIFYIKSLPRSNSLRQEWENYVIDNLSHLNRYINEDCPDELAVWWRENRLGKDYYKNSSHIGVYSVDLLPEGFVYDFYKSHDIPKIPEESTIDYWEGKIGFSGIGDNSIPFEDFEKIYDIFDACSWHLG